MKIQLLKPENNAVVSQQTGKQQSLSSASTCAERTGKKRYAKLDWLHLKKQGKDNSAPAPVVFQWKTDLNENSEFTVWFMLSMNRYFRNSHPVPCTEETISLTNLFLGQTYYWKIYATKNGKIVCSSDVFCFSTALEPPRWINASGLSNVRDIGGWPLENEQRIRQGLVFRGCEMEFHHAITDEGKNVLLNELHIKTDLDLREEAVGKISCSALGEEDIKFCLIPVKAYDAFLADNQKESCRRVFHLFSDKDNYPFYVHCWGGADRTGTLIFLLCAILGMAEKDLYLDYELTSLSIWGERSRNSDLFQAFLKTLNAYTGKTVYEKTKNFLLSTGVLEREIDAIRRILIEE